MEQKLETTVTCRSRRIFSNGQTEERGVEIVTEHTLHLTVNGTMQFDIVCTPANLKELVVGRLITEQLIFKSEEIKALTIAEDGHTAEVTLTHELPAERPALPILPKAEYRTEWIFDLANRFSEDSAVHRLTSGTHSCYLSVDGRFVYGVEDLGRHNTLDKAIGFAALMGYDRTRCILYSTGRVPTDMVQKVVAAGIPILAAKSVPTREGVAFAKAHHLTLLCRTWPDSYEIYNEG